MTTRPKHTALGAGIGVPPGGDPRRGRPAATPAQAFSPTGKRR